MKLHLGCGQIYLKGYLNIDFPLSKHSIQNKSVADKHADILKLSYPENSIEEIRLHHVFEHFTRPVACALITKWYTWLKPNGILRIEVPDFQRTAKVVLNPFNTDRKKLLAIRHIFGSHEAQWAIHCEGYTPESLSTLLKMYGFKINKINKNSWKGTYNIEVIANKISEKQNKKQFEKITINYLKQFLVDESESELKLLAVWMNEYKKQIKKLNNNPDENR